ncbi:hypothetical protein HPB52_018642 [Rhipicephalus sanguineus]|uniref:Uncharacterized protein n=1 Tax=Rhipicephalus sanguineus TaxID=34632 RepID=A0A9D4SUX6_RHISA|nr:hypothetical protein HPB52_018642 [Rhipicephalus sanguineus]
MQSHGLHKKLYIGAAEVKNLQMKIKFDFTRHQERPLIAGFQADGQRYVELQEGTTTRSLLQTIANLAGATVDGLVTQGSVTLYSIKTRGLKLKQKFAENVVSSDFEPFNSATIEGVGQNVWFSYRTTTSWPRHLLLPTGSGPITSCCSSDLFHQAASTTLAAKPVRLCFTPSTPTTRQ